MSIQRTLVWSIIGCLLWMSVCFMTDSIAGTYLGFSSSTGLVGLLAAVLAILWDIGVIKLPRSSFKPTYYLSNIGLFIFSGYVLFFFFPLKDDMPPARLFIWIASGNVIILSISLLFALVKEFREFRQRAHQHRLQS